MLSLLKRFHLTIKSLFPICNKYSPHPHPGPGSHYAPFYLYRFAFGGYTCKETIHTMWCLLSSLSESKDQDSSMTQSVSELPSFSLLSMLNLTCMDMIMCSPGEEPVRLFLVIINNAVLNIFEHPYIKSFYAHVFISFWAYI